jgi:hypothetical protein
MIEVALLDRPEYTYLYTFGLFSTVVMLHDEERSIIFFSRGPHLIFTFLPAPRAL